MEAQSSPGRQKFALGTFSKGGGDHFVGVVLDDQFVVPLDHFGASLGVNVAGVRMDGLLPFWDRLLDVISMEVASADLSRYAISIGELTIYSPVSPRQIICTGANYKKHVIDLVVAQGAGVDTEGMSVEERREHVTRRVEQRAKDGIPYAFPKLISSLADPFSQITIPSDAKQFDWELELGVVISKPAWRVPRSEAFNYVAGYTIVNDLSRRELIYRDDMRGIGTDWLRAKSGPGFMPCGPFLVPQRFVADPQDLKLRLTVNGKTMQNESTADMIFDIAAQIEYVSSYARLLPGDLLATGSPAGNGMHHGVFLQAGDIMTGAIEGLGMQRNTFVKENN